MTAPVTASTTPARFALYVRGSFKSRWRLHSRHPTRDLAVAASFAAKATHVWVTVVPHAPPAPAAWPAEEPAHV